LCSIGNRKKRKCYCKGRISTANLERVYDKRIKEKSIICTDSHKSYIQFAEDFSLEHKQIKTGQHKNGIYHINHINALHSNLKNWIRHFKSVSTKYLTNYLYWFKWLEKTKQDKDAVKSRTLLLDSVIEPIDTRQQQYRGRQPIFI